MYRFVGKNKQMYVTTFNEVSVMKLNYNCPDSEKYTQGLFGQSSNRVIANLKNKISEELSKKGYNGIQLEHNMDTDFNRSIDLNPNNKVPEIVPTKKEPIMEKNTVAFKPAKNIKEGSNNV